MDFQVIILATLIVVVLFQIIILVNQQKNGKTVRELMAQRARPFQSDRGGDRGDRFRDRNTNPNRQNRNREQDSRSKPAQAPAAPVQGGAVDNVEKSLRDINLKLKNAERDQEDARRRIQDGNPIGGGNRDQSRRRHHGDNRGGGGSRDEGRDHRRGGGDRDRNNRNNWHNRNDQDRPFHEEQPTDQPDAEIPATAISADAAIGAIPQAASMPELNASDFDSDNTEHGRKFMVRRRMLKEEQAGDTNEESPEGSASSFSGAAVDVSSDTPTEQTGDAEISFGRR